MIYIYKVCVQFVIICILTTTTQAQPQTKTSPKQNNAILLQAIDQRLKIMQELAKRFEVNIKKRRSTTAKKTKTLTTVSKMAGGIGRWGSDKAPLNVWPDYPDPRPTAMRKCKERKLTSNTGLSSYVSCIP